MITLPKLSQEKKRQGRKGSIIVFAAECRVRIQHPTSGLERYTTFGNPIYLDKPQHCLFNYTSLEISFALGCSNYLKNTKQTSKRRPCVSSSVSRKLPIFPTQGLRSKRRSLLCVFQVV